MQAAGVTRYNEGRSLDEIKLSPYVTPDRWGDADNGVIIAGLLGTAVTVLLTLIAAAIALKKKHPVCALLLVLLIAFAAAIGTYAGKLFVEWDNLPLYGFADLMMLLSVAGFCFIAAWAKNGCSLPKGKKPVGKVFTCIALVALPYELIVFLINNVIFKGKSATVSIILASFSLMAVIVISLAITVVGLRKAKKEEK